MGNILVADDSLVQRRVLERALLSDGHRVYMAENGLAAMQVIGDNDIDVLITDIFMPEIDGIELIMKAKEFNKNMGVIAISGGGDLIKGNRYLDYANNLEQISALQSQLMKQTSLTQLNTF